MTSILKYPRIEATKEEAEGITVSELLEMKALFDRLTPVEKKDVLAEARKIALGSLAHVIAGAPSACRYRADDSKDGER